MVRKSLNSKADIACHLICLISKNTGSQHQHPCYQLELGVNLDIEIKFLGGEYLGTGTLARLQPQGVQINI